MQIEVNTIGYIGRTIKGRSLTDYDPGGTFIDLGTVPRTN